MEPLITILPEEGPEKYLWAIDFLNPSFARALAKAMENMPKDFYPKHRETAIKLFNDLSKQLKPKGKIP